MSHLLTIGEVCARVGVSRTTIYARMNERQFPAPIKIGTKSVRWRSDERCARGLTLDPKMSVPRRATEARVQRRSVPAA